MGDKVSRREFLRRAVTAGAAITGVSAVSGIGSALASDPRSRVIQVTDRSVISRDGDLLDSVVGKMVGKGICELSGAKSSVAAWQKYFSPQDVVGLKINCMFGKGASTHPEVVHSIIAGLLSAGVAAESIIVWDRSAADLTQAGYVINRDGPGPRYLGTDGGWGDEVALGSFKGRLATILTRDITALINVPILKHHGTLGITCALKNHYGSISNPGEYHGESGNAALADINCLPAIKDKTRLVIVDAIRPLADGGPGLSKPEMLWGHHSVVMSTDPVAVDYTGWRIIESRRKELGLKPETQPAHWLANATARGLGSSDAGKIDVVKI